MKRGRTAAMVMAVLFAAGGGPPAEAQVQDGQMAGASVRFRMGEQGSMKVEAVADNIVHVQFAKDPAFFAHESFAVPAALPAVANGSSGISNGGFLVKTPLLQARINLEDGSVEFQDKSGAAILAEVAGGRSMEAAQVQGEQTFHVRQQWLADADEAFYGLGQHQYGLTNIRGYDIELWQHNTEIAVPLLLSSKGYGIFWENNSYTKFGDPREYVAIPAEKLTDASGGGGGFTRTSFSDAGMTQQTAQRQEAAIAAGGAAAGGARGRGRGGPMEQAVRWEGEVLADVAGDYKFQLYANGGSKMWIDGNLVADHWRQNWLPMNDLAVKHFAPGSKHKIKVEWVKDGGTYCTLMWKPPEGDDEGNTSLWSQVGDGVDYYFIYGPSMDKIIAGYRQLTGKAPMMPVWAFGLWQSRQRYETQQASLDVVKGFRDRKIPFDNIVQDWMYWRQDDWGSHDFDTQRFPDPDQWVKDIHALNAHVMISVWGKYYPTTDNFKAMNEKGFLYPVNPAEKDWVGRGFQYAFYDAFNPAAGQMFWDQVNKKLFSKGFDAWWMDATEPDLTQPSPPLLENQLKDMGKTAAGISARVANAYPLLNSKAVYEGQRAAAPDQRVFILTRSGYAGQQRYAAASWSGDISSSWTAMKKQIAAGLGYSISGLPYWTMDSGGFSVPGKFNGRNVTPAALDEWREMNARWFEFAAFVPLLRVHGEAPFREMWQFGGDDSDAYKAELKADRLRYRLLPYIYSLAGDVTQNDGTFMRPLVMDFPGDKTARDLNDQYMFGPAIMVSPVTTYKVRSRDVYLPGGTAWYDFWTGAAMNGGMTIKEAAAPYDQIPLHVRAGSIVPFGPELQYVAEKKGDPLTLYVYAGHDGAFSLYEDDGVSYQYEQGKFSRIPMRWNDAEKTLTLGKREGNFAGMLNERTVQVIFVTPEKAGPFAFEAKPDKTVTYRGDSLDVKMN